MHMGDMAIRFRSVTPRSVKGEKSWDMMASWGGRVGSNPFGSDPRRSTRG
jgi:hypothetical protein